MSEDALVDEAKADKFWYEDDIAVRGCHLNLPQIKAAYRELSVLTKQEADRIVGALLKLDGESDEDFEKRKQFLKDEAFRVTVSIVGFNDETAFGDRERIFDSKELPLPIKTIYFTNITAFKPHADGAEPRNRFAVWLHFHKPPLFDPNPLVSEPTPNPSKVEIAAEDVGYIRAIQTIVGNKLKSDKKWHAFIHEKFAYDIGLWFIALPYALYWITIYSDYFFPAGSSHASFRIAFYIYGIGLSLLLYRALFGYLKWAFPVNILDENKDRAMRHRLMLGAILSSLVISGVKSGLSTVAGI